MTIWTPLEGTDLEVGGVRFSPASDVHFFDSPKKAQRVEIWAATADGPAAPPVAMSLGGFCIVEAVPLSGDDYEIVGVFTRRVDAEAYMAELEACPYSILKGTAVLEEGISMEVIKRVIAKDLLGPLAASIDRLLEAASLPKI